MGVDIEKVAKLVGFVDGKFKQFRADCHRYCPRFS